MVTTATLEAITPRQSAVIITGALEGAKELVETGTSVLAVALGVGTRAWLALKRGVRIVLNWPQ